MGAGGLPATDESTAVYGSGQTVVLEAAQSFTLRPGFHAKAGSTVTVRIASGSGGTLMDGDYDVSNITYDANGNILTLKRNKATDGTGNTMDDLAYTYKPGTNQLLRVEDAVGDVANADDIGTQTGDNYEYNAIGQLIRNNSEEISYIYNASGLVTEVQRNNLPLVKFFYNDRNHRTKKESYNGGSLASTDYYVRDVAGQVMAIYSDYDGSMALAEQPIYGAGRIGVAYNGTSNNKTYTYELTDHLGNVRAVFSKSGSDAQLEGYTDYYPGGMAMPGRNVVGDYRYNYQGQELDKETGKVAFELRLYDPRINRWLAPDPAGQYDSPYLSMGNNWISRVDPDGGFDWYVNNETGELEWHNTSGSIDGLTWVGTNSASHDYLSSIGKTFGGSGKISFSDIAARAYYDITGGFNEGLAQRGKDFAAFVENPVDRTLQGVANTIDSGGAFINDFVASGESDLSFFAMSRAYDTASSMTLYDWSYAAGYSAPDLALGFGGGYALSTLRLGLTGEAVFQSSTFGYRSRLFGRHHSKFLPDGRRGLLNRGPLRTGWGNHNGRHVFRTSIGNPPNNRHIDWFYRN